MEIVKGFDAFFMDEIEARVNRNFSPCTPNWWQISFI